MGACGAPHLLLHQLPPQAAPGTECRRADGGGGRGVARNVRVAAHRLRRHLAQFSAAATVLSNPGRALALQVHPVSWQGSGQVGCCCSSPMASVTRPGRMLMRYPRLVSTCSMAKRRGGRAGLCTQPRHVLRHQDSSGRVCECSGCCCWEQPSAHRQEVCGGAAAGCLGQAALLGRPHPPFRYHVPGGLKGSFGGAFRQPVACVASVGWVHPTAGRMAKLGRRHGTRAAGVVAERQQARAVA